MHNERTYGRIGSGDILVGGGLGIFLCVQVEAEKSKGFTDLCSYAGVVLTKPTGKNEGIQPTQRRYH